MAVVAAVQSAAAFGGRLPVPPAMVTGAPAHDALPVGNSPLWRGEANNDPN